MEESREKERQKYIKTAQTDKKFKKKVKKKI